MPKTSLHELAHSAREGQADQRKQYMVGVAESVYQSPRHYGFRNADEVGEAFCHYWTRIEAFPEHYIDTGTSFEAYLTSSLRFIALSIRRNLAKEFDRQAVCLEEQHREVSSSYTSSSWSWHQYGDFCRLHETAAFSTVRRFLPDDKDTRVFARAFRTRLTYLCIKCAHLLDDLKIIELARLAGLDPEIMMHWIHAARLGLSHRSLRTTTRRRGRDSAWVRIGVNRRRLAREVDPDIRQMLRSRIERDHGVYIRACKVIHNSRTMLPNREVAEILGVSKSTVDSGVARILKKYLPLYADEQG